MEPAPRTAATRTLTPPWSPGCDWTPDYARRITPPLDEEALLAAARAGDRAALDRLLRAHYDRIHAVCRRITGSETDADDAAQNALIAIVRALPRFDGRSAFSSWVYRIATNASLDELRRRKRRPLAAATDEPLESGSHDERFETRLAERLSVDEALATLPEEFRVAVVLRDLVDMDYAEIAESLQIPPGTVRSRIARGRSLLARALGDESGNQSDGGGRQTGASPTTEHT
ncbi:MAG TPA: RNA polymerase sigma factor [Acidimicrobiales bacterium]